MRAVILFLIVSVTSVASIHAQEKKNNSNDKHFSIPKIDLFLTDSLTSPKSKNIDSLLSKRDKSVNIPNAYTGNKLVDQMPIKKLNGVGLAQMPGTENLGRLGISGQLDSLNLQKKYKK